MSTLRIQNLSKWFDATPAVRRLDLQVEDGEFLVVLGPSGCGKTTALRCLAGIETPTTGEIYFGDECVFSDELGIDVVPKKRDIGLVFQNYALYPHLTVAQNVAFGLRIRKYSKSAIERTVREVLSFVGLDGLEDRLPSALSGGQRQRVALARMVARRPSILLFDEPLSSLDLKLRSFLRAELKELHRKLSTTSLFVTHDQSEAMILGDRIAVMDDGEIVQIGTPDTIYHYPNSISVASFTARPKTNLIPGRVDQSGSTTIFRPDEDREAGLAFADRLNLAAGQRMILHVRPEELDIAFGARKTSFVVYAVQPQGAETLIHLAYRKNDAKMRSDLLVRSTNSRATRLSYGQNVALTMRRGNLYSAETELLVASFGDPIARDQMISR